MRTSTVYRTSSAQPARELDDFTRQAAAYALAETCRLAGDDRCVVEAAAQFRFVIEWAFDFSAWAWPRVLLWSPLAHERLAEAAHARAEVERVLRMWRDPDPDLPWLADAKALRARLRARTGPN